MKSVFSINDVYPFSGQSASTSHETIPEEIERKQYQDSTTERSDGKTEVIEPVDIKLIFIAIAVFVVVGSLLGLIEV